MNKAYTLLVDEANQALKRLDTAIANMQSFLQPTSLEVAEDLKDAQDLNLTQIVVGSNVKFGSKSGTVVQLYKRIVSKTVNKKKITIEGTPENPAVLIKDKSGKEYLKLAKDLTPF